MEQVLSNFNYFLLVLDYMYNPAAVAAAAAGNAYYGATAGGMQTYTQPPSFMTPTMPTSGSHVTINQRPLPDPDDKVAVEEHLIIQTIFYFCVQNLKKDSFLLSHMDKDGFVEIALIATFNRVKNYVDHDDLTSYKQVCIALSISVIYIIINAYEHVISL